MVTLMHKFELSENRIVNLLMDFYVGFDISNKTMEELSKLVNEKTETTYSIGAYTKNGEHGGHFPKEFSVLPDGKFELEELVIVLNNLGSTTSVEEINKLLLNSLLDKREYVSSHGKIKEVLESL